MTIENKEKVWEQVLHEFELIVSKANYSTWFKHTFLSKEENGKVYIGIPNNFTRDWLHPKYTKEIIRLLRKISNSHVGSIEYVIAKKPQKEIVSAEKKGLPQKNLTQSNTLPLDNLYINKKDNLNTRYTFDTFIIGSFNELAYSATQGILNQPSVYNPLFIYGSTGLGKTHLIQATGNKFKEKYPKAKVFYTSAEKFSNDYVLSVQNNRTIPFKDKYREYDVLIMDDVQFLSGKQRTQDELFHVFNILHDQGKQIIFSSDKHPNFIPGLEDRLKSRFSAGMIVDITRPEYESRFAILQKKADKQNIFIKPEIISYIAEHVDGNIRELEGVLNSIICHMQMRSKETNLQEVKKLIKNSVKAKKQISVDEVVKIIANFYSIDPQTIYEKTRRREIVHSRQVVMYLLREDFNISFPTIGRKLGGRDHTTVIHSHAKIQENLEKDTNLAQDIERIRSMITT